MASKGLSDEQITELTLKRFAPLREGRRETPLGELAEKFGCSRNTAATSIRRAFQRRLVEVRRMDPDTHMLTNPSLDFDLADRLKSAFPSLLDATVVRTDQSNGDRVHRNLGFAIARQLRGIIPHGATVGVGSGRGPYYSVYGAVRLPRLPQEGITLMSLAGAVYPESHDGEINALLDADFHTGLLSVCFSKPIKQRMISRPIAHRNVEAVRADTWLDEDEFLQHVPTVAIVGVGVMRGHHRFFQAVQNESRGTTELEPIYADLEKLVVLTKRYSTDLYCPVGDICNRLFFINPPAGEGMGDKTRMKFQVLIERVNGGLLTIDEQQLGMIRDLCLVAGTTQKAFAIRQLLQADRDSSWPVSVGRICTDAETARIILSG